MSETSSVEWVFTGIDDDPSNLSRTSKHFNQKPNNKISSVTYAPLNPHQDLTTIIKELNSRKRKVPEEFKFDSNFIKRTRWEESVEDSKRNEKVNLEKEYRQIPLSKLEIRRGILFGKLKRVPFDPNLDPELGQCFNCRKKGHGRKQCPYPLGPIFCDNCGRRKVNIQSCPRCAGAYKMYLQRFRQEPTSNRRKRVYHRPTTETTEVSEVNNSSFDNQFILKDSPNQKAAGRHTITINDVPRVEEEDPRTQTIEKTNENAASPTLLNTVTPKIKVNERLNSILALVRETHDLPVDLRELILRQAFW